MTQLIASTLSDSRFGTQIALKVDDKIETIALVNGNKVDFAGPIVLTSIDQYVVFGMSHPSVVSRIFDTGPQILVTTKELGHTLFEHGMKASVGRIRLRNNPVTTTLDTFYDLRSKYHKLSIKPSRRRNEAVCVVSISGYEPITLSSSSADDPDIALHRLNGSVVKTLTPLRIPLDGRGEESNS